MSYPEAQVLSLNASLLQELAGGTQRFIFEEKKKFVMEMRRLEKGLRRRLTF